MQRNASIIAIETKMHPTKTLKAHSGSRFSQSIFARFFLNKNLSAPPSVNFLRKTRMESPGLFSSIFLIHINIYEQYK